MFDVVIAKVVIRHAFWTAIILILPLLGFEVTASLKHCRRTTEASL
jgi:hypothetical protein